MNYPGLKRAAALGAVLWLTGCESPTVTVIPVHAPAPGATRTPTIRPSATLTATPTATATASPTATATTAAPTPAPVGELLAPASDQVYYEANAFTGTAIDQGPIPIVTYDFAHITSGYTPTQTSGYLKAYVFYPPTQDPQNPRLTPCLFYIHGGGGTGGNPVAYGYSLLVTAASIGWTGVAIQYRTYNSHGGGMDFAAFSRLTAQDTYWAWRWFQTYGAAIGCAVTSTAIIGDSYGGGLALGLPLQNVRSQLAPPQGYSNDIRTDTGKPATIIALSPIITGVDYAVGGETLPIMPYENASASDVTDRMPGTFLQQGQLDTTAPPAWGDAYAARLNSVAPGVALAEDYANEGHDMLFSDYPTFWRSIETWFEMVQWLPSGFPDIVGQITNPNASDNQALDAVTEMWGYSIPLVGNGYNPGGVWLSP